MDEKRIEEIKLETQQLYEDYSNLCDKWEKTMSPRVFCGGLLAMLMNLAYACSPNIESAEGLFRMCQAEALKIYLKEQAKNETQ